MSRVIHVRAPARLHFGMFSFGHAKQPQFGGVGMMIGTPQVAVAVAPARQFTVTGCLVERANRCVQQIFASWGLSEYPPCHVHIDGAPATHTGLGVGTQLALSLFTGLAHFLNRGADTAEEIAQTTGRGRRSAVGTYGFLQGGLIVDAGKLAGQALGQLESQHPVPDHWRVVLVGMRSTTGLSGSQEARAFERLPPVPQGVTDRLWSLARNHMIPALQRDDASAFGEAVYEFGMLAGGTFAAVQGGPFATPQAADLVEAIRRFGIAGVGQSSWGPTLFAIAGDHHQAVALTNWLVDNYRLPRDQLVIARPNNSGAVVEVKES